MDRNQMDKTPEEELSEAILEQEMPEEDYSDELYQDAPEQDLPIKEKPMKKKKTKKKGTRVFLIVTCSVLALVLLLMVVATVMVYRWLGLINRTDGYVDPMTDEEMQAYLEENTDPFDPNYTGEILDPDDVEWVEDSGLVHSEQVVNILLVGSDSRSSGDRGRSDSMILCSYNPKTKTMVMTSLLRDMYVQIPGYQDNRINASYAFGGLQLLNKTLEKNLGVKVDGNFVIEFEGFAKVIDLVGGVDITLTQAEANYMNKKAVDSKMRGQFKAGKTHLCGEDALFYARIRYIDSDFGRTQRQRTVMMAVYNKCKNLSLSQLYSLMDDVLPLMTTDLTNSEIMSYAGEFLPVLSELKVESLHIPVDGSYRNARIRNMAVLVPNLETNRRVLAEIISGK